MRDKLLALYELQRIESQALELERSGKAIPQEIQELEASVEVLRSELGQMRAEADEKRTEQRELEAQASEETNKHRQWKRRLNEIKAPREFQALSREIELGERQVRRFEDSVMELMAELEEKEKLIDTKSTALKQCESEVGDRVGTLKSSLEEIARDAEKIRSGRREILDQLPKSLARKFEQIRARRNGIAVALVEGGACAGCNVKLRPQLVVEILRYTSIEQCPLCNRVLVHEELLKADAAQEAPRETT